MPQLLDGLDLPSSLVDLPWFTYEKPWLIFRHLAMILSMESAGDFLELNRPIIHDVLKQQTMGVSADNFGGIVYFNINLYSYIWFVNYIVCNLWENLFFFVI